ncbi:CCA tRNA nucleotidyltransferase [Oecophyllibacter saccharovorans]|uniref:CCA tRNA nucleotidyltransferase n=1 Tax=Oecophyllibacter saccharovorans TaxID=2558360 RepID=UPI002F26838A
MPDTRRVLSHHEEQLPSAGEDTHASEQEKLIWQRLSVLPERAGVERIWSVLPQARLVGGCVRDFLCGRPVHDIDMASPLPPEEATPLLEAAGLKVVPTGLAHGTLTVVHESRPYELTTLRHDVETDGRHAVVAWTDDWREDAARRDFTINALSFDRAGKLHDEFGGVKDLAEGRVRFVGNAARRLEEDALRALRFFRFQARYGSGTPDGEAVAAIRAGVELTRRLSVERVASELLRLLTGPRLLPTLRLMEETTLLNVLLPQAQLAGLARLLACGNMTEDEEAPSLSAVSSVQAQGRNEESEREERLGLLRLYALCPDEGLGARLKLSRLARHRLHVFAQNVPELSPDMTDDDLRRAAAGQELSLLEDRSWLLQAAELGRPDAGWEALRARLGAMTRPVFPLSGKDGLACGLQPGPALGQWLCRTRDWWLSEGCRPDAQACRQWLAQEIQRSESIR